MTGIVIGVCDADEPLLRNSIASPRMNLSNRPNVSGMSGESPSRNMTYVGQPASITPREM